MNPYIDTASCNNLWLGYCVCVGVLPSPIQEPVDAGCTQYDKVSPSSTCDTIASANGISLAEFYEWNPSIDRTRCNNLWLGYYVCVRSRPAPIKEPVADNCRTYHKVSQSTETCDAVARASGISLADLHRWNPSINAACTNLWLGYYICTGVY